MCILEKLGEAFWFEKHMMTFWGPPPVVENRIWPNTLRIKP